MEIKFTKKLSEYDYLVMFDLASKVSGVCVWNIKNGKPEYTSKLVVKDGVVNRAYSLFSQIDCFFVGLKQHLGDIDMSKVLVYRELCPMQQGKFTTAKTLIALGKAHAVLDLYLAQHGLDFYDLEGVAPATTHAYYRRLVGMPSSSKIEKTDIRDYLVSEYGISSDLSLDETDAVFLAKTFVDVFWDKEIDELVKERKRHLKTLKAENAIEKVKSEMAFLSSLKHGQ